MKFTAVWLTLLAGLSACMTAVETEPVNAPLPVKVIETKLAHLDGRYMSTRIWVPGEAGHYPVIVFSHGAFSSPAKYHPLLTSWAEAGYIVLAALHVDSEVLNNDPPPSRAVTWYTRVEDVALLLEPPVELVAFLREERIEIDGDKTIAAGHSYGALIAQLFAGARAKAEPDKEPETHFNARVAGVVALSPPGPLKGMVDETAWDELRLPQLVITGTADVLPGFIDDWQLHRWSHDRAKSSPNWLWIGDGVDHYFGNLIGRTERTAKPQQAAFNAAVSTSLDFLNHVLPSFKAQTFRAKTFPPAVATIEKK